VTFITKRKLRRISDTAEEIIQRGEEGEVEKHKIVNIKHDITLTQVKNPNTTLLVRIAKLFLTIYMLVIIGFELSSCLARIFAPLQEFARRLTPRVLHLFAESIYFLINLLRNAYSYKQT
jgi:hypothetical protein